MQKEEIFFFRFFSSDGNIFSECKTLFIPYAAEKRFLPNLAFEMGIPDHPQVSIEILMKIVYFSYSKKDIPEIIQRKDT